MSTTEKSATGRIRDILENELPQDGSPLTISSIEKSGEALPWRNVRATIKYVSDSMGIKVKTRLVDGELVIWRA